jgi:hypothetical protein
LTRPSRIPVTLQAVPADFEFHEVLQMLLVEEPGEGRRIADVRQAGAVGVDPVADRAEGVVERDRPDLEVVDPELMAGQDLVELEVGRHRLERDRKELVPRDAADDLLELVGGGAQGIDRDAGARHVGRLEERQPLDVVPVNVRQHHMVVPGGMGGLLGGQLLAEPAQTGAGVHDETAALLAAHLHTGRVPSVAHGVRSRNRIAPAHAPEGHLHFRAIVAQPL